MSGELENRVLGVKTDGTRIYNNGDVNIWIVVRNEVAEFLNHRTFPGVFRKTKRVEFVTYTDNLANKEKILFAVSLSQVYLADFDWNSHEGLKKHLPATRVIRITSTQDPLHAIVIIAYAIV